MEHGAPIDQHTVARSLILHLGPGVLIAAAYFALTPLLGRAGYPSVMALMCAIPLVLVPTELGYLIYLGCKRNGRLSLEGIVLNRARIPVWQYFVWVPLVFILVGVIFNLLEPVDAMLHRALFAWMPAMDSGLEPGYDRTALIWTYGMIAVFGVVAGPVVEELYFRGFLLPRTRFAGRWAPALHSLLFAAYHFWTPWQLIARTLAVLPVAYAAERRNLYIGMIVHVLANSLDVITGVAFIISMQR